MREHLEQLTLDVRAALADPEAGPAFFAFPARMTTEADAKQDLTEAITAAGGPMGAAAEELAAQLRELFGALLTHAQQAAAVRDDVDAADVQAIVVAALAAGRLRGANDRPERLAEVVFDCLLPRHGWADSGRAIANLISRSRGRALAAAPSAVPHTLAGRAPGAERDTRETPTWRLWQPADMP
ncbi:hypothetical protein [Streptomyces cellostaticus]|uniref:SbtR family transcriptional regulator n=1 Tax=Streptomyces cellostaticus TaxID=67285 RepID=UPI000A545854|nr:hypothetical protein [Streptomyces cellostaticus]GHI01707.1 hypothetical protein Scel_00280 [Streptomyces cellostaticus]